MKKTITKFVLFAACSTAIQAKAQWMEDATTIWTKKTNLNVGIGLSNPAAKLDIYNSTNLNTAAGSVTDIAGFAGLTNSKSALKVQLYRHSDGLDWLSASTRLQAATDGAHQAYLEFNPKGAPAGLALGTTSGNAITINDNGNVGIGTISPNSKLEIINTSTLTYPLIGTAYGALHIVPKAGSAANSSAAITFGAAESFNSSQAGIYVQSSSAYGTKMYFGTSNSYATGTQSRMMIDPNGNVGIGTISPNSKLDVLGAFRSYYVGIGQEDNLTSVKNYANFGSNIHGSVLISSNLYFGADGNLKTANNHPTLSGTAIVIPGNGQSEQGSIVFYTNQPSAATADNIFTKNPVMILNAKGNVGIGTTNPTQKLSVNGTIQAKEIVVNTGWSDFVFDNNYKLRPLTEVEQFVKTNKHLPEIPSQKEVEKNGVPLGDISSKLLMKIEELTLYIIQQQKEIEKQKAINNILVSKIEKLETKQ